MIILYMIVMSLIQENWTLALITDAGYTAERTKYEESRDLLFRG